MVKKKKFENISPVSLNTQSENKEKKKKKDNLKGIIIFSIIMIFKTLSWLLGTRPVMV